MLRNAVAVVTASSVLLSGCTAILRETRYPGGYPGYVLDERTFNTSHQKSLALLRSAILVAIAARIGEANVSASDADAFAGQISDAAMEINYAAFAIGYGDPVGEQQPPVATSTSTYACSITGQRLTASGNLVDAAEPAGEPAKSLADYAKCGDYYVNFESTIPRIESRVLRAMLTALPTDEARKFLTKAEGGDMLGAILALVRTFGKVAGSFHRGAATYRSGMEAVSAGIGNCQYDDTFFGEFDSDSEIYREYEDTTLKAAACLGFSKDQLLEGKEITARELGRNRVSPGALIAMMLIAQQSCAALPLVSSIEAGDVLASNLRRRKACEKMTFKPVARPKEVEPLVDTVAPTPTPSNSSVQD